MKARVFGVRAGQRISPAVAQRAGELFFRLTASSVSVSAEQFLAAAKTDKLLRDQFEWDDTIAANKYRLHTARQLMGCFTVVVIRQHRQVTVRGAHYIDSAGGYVSAPVLFLKSNQDMLAERLVSARADAKGFAESYAALRGVDDGVGAVIRAIEEWIWKKSERQERKGLAGAEWRGRDRTGVERQERKGSEGKGAVGT